ncbi:hypothetical protein ACFX1R_027864 [Malus domestica]
MEPKRELQVAIQKTLKIHRNPSSWNTLSTFRSPNGSEIQAANQRRVGTGFGEVWQPLTLEVLSFIALRYERSRRKLWSSFVYARVRNWRVLRRWWAGCGGF